MNHSKNKFMEQFFREKYTKEVILELFERANQKKEQERSEIEAILREEENQNKLLLRSMESQFPLYETQGASIYLERLGKNQLHPFRKRTAFSKPIQEQYTDTFKSE